jgi:hypothetical protein
MAGLNQRGSPAMLAFYGDHLPSLSDAFRHFGFDEPSVDYAIWPSAGAAQRSDLRAHELGRLLVVAVLGAGPGRPDAGARARAAVTRSAYSAAVRATSL